MQWTNFGPDLHSATRLGVFDSDLLEVSEMYEFVFGPSLAGYWYHYICVLHPEMTGEIGVAQFGDANIDGRVDLADFNILAANFGSSANNWAPSRVATVSVSEVNRLSR